jgi:hypothetical protein
VARILLLLVPTNNCPSTINTIFVGGTVIEMSQDFPHRDCLQVTSTALGRKEAFGCLASDIGTKSLWSGAAVALFLLLSRWKSAAFLVCIRPQVLEWTNNMSQGCDPP